MLAEHSLCSADMSQYSANKRRRIRGLGRGADSHWTLWLVLAACRSQCLENETSFCEDKCPSEMFTSNSTDIYRYNYDLKKIKQLHFTQILYAITLSEANITNYL
jgi:hypothetical protein